jgi:hypothetical protein
MKHFKFVPMAALFLALCGTTTRAVAQDKPDVHYITQTTQKIVIPDGSTEEDMWEVMQEYYDKVLAKSVVLKHYEVYRHAWGSLGATVVITLEFNTWEDIMKFNEIEREALEKAAWPDEAARKAFIKKMNSFEDPYHRDEIYVVRNSMRK